MPKFYKKNKEKYLQGFKLIALNLHPKIKRKKLVRLQHFKVLLRLTNKEQTKNNKTINFKKL
jgi:hypothetical protein